LLGVQGNTEADKFRRIELNVELERAEKLIADYRQGIDFFRDRMDKHQYELGRIEERLDEPNPQGA
jgi:hypothetical protein